MQKKIFLGLTVLLGLLIDFAVLAKAGHDLWAATVVYLVVLILLSVLWVTEVFDEDSAGFQMKSILLALPMVVVFSVSYLHAVNPSESFSELMDWIFTLLVFFIAQQLFRHKKNLLVFLMVVLPLFPIEFLLHIRQKYIWGWPSGVFGTLLNSNVSAAFHLFWIPLLFLATQHIPFEKRTNKIIIGCVSFSLLGTLALVQSTSALMCIILSLPIIIGWSRLRELREKNRMGFDVIALVMIVVFWIFFGVKIAEVISGRQFGLGHPYTSRLVWWKSGWAMFGDHPLFGIGIGNYPSAYLAYKVGAGVNTLFPHSFVVSLLSETGLLGLLAAGLFFANWLITSWQSWDGEEYRPFLLGAVIALLFCSFNVGLEYLAITLTLAVFMGASVAADESLSWKPRKSVLLVVLAVAFFSVPYLVSPFLASQRIVSGFNLLVTEPASVVSAKDFSEAIDLDPRNFMSYQGLAKIHAQNALKNHDAKEFEVAINDQMQAVARNQLSARLWWELAAYLEAVRDFSKAKEAYAKASQYDLTNKKFMQDKERTANY